MFFRCSKIGKENILDESLLERFPECSCRHVQLNSVHIISLAPGRQYLSAIKSLPVHKQMQIWKKGLFSEVSNNPPHIFFCLPFCSLCVFHSFIKDFDVVFRAFFFFFFYLYHPFSDMFVCNLRLQFPLFCVQRLPHFTKCQPFTYRLTV